MDFCETFSKSLRDAETSLIFISPRFSMTEGGFFFAVIPNLVRDLGFGFLVLKPRPVGGVLYLELEIWSLVIFCYSTLGRGNNPAISVILLVICSHSIAMI